MSGDALITELELAAMLTVAGGRVSPERAALRRIRVGATQDGQPQGNVCPQTGRLLAVLAGLCGARKAVEVGTRAGYSAGWIAGALGPGGRLHTVEKDTARAAEARRNLRRAGLGRRVVVHAGPAAEVLETLAPRGPFDLAFFDGDQLNNPAMLRWAARNLRPGGLAVFDDAYRFCRLYLKPEETGGHVPSLDAMKDFLGLLGRRSVFSQAAVLPIRNGLAIAIKARSGRRSGRDFV